MLGVGHTAVYKGAGRLWVASRISRAVIGFFSWLDPINIDFVIKRTHLDYGWIAHEDATAIAYTQVWAYDGGVPADAFGNELGPFDVTITAGEFYLNGALVGQRIGYTALPPYYSLQYCGAGPTKCPRDPSQPGPWDGWPFWALPLMRGGDIDFILFTPWDYFPYTGLYGGYETAQAYWADHGTHIDIHGRDPFPCTPWTVELGLCVNGAAYNAFANGTLKVIGTIDAPQWWFDLNHDHVVQCSEFSYPHGVGVRATADGPTRVESTWADSQPGSCVLIVPSPHRG